MLRGLSASLPVDPWHAAGCSSRLDRTAAAAAAASFSTFYRHHLGPLSSSSVVFQQNTSPTPAYTDHL